MAELKVRELKVLSALSQGQHQNRYHQPHRVRSNLQPSALKERDGGE